MCPYGPKSYAGNAKVTNYTTLGGRVQCTQCNALSKRSEYKKNKGYYLVLSVRFHH